MNRRPYYPTPQQILAAKEQIKAEEDEEVFRRLDDIAFGHCHRVRSHVNGLGSCEWCGETVKVGDEEECPMFTAWSVMES